MSLQPLTRSDRRALLPLLIIAVALVAALLLLPGTTNSPQHSGTPADTTRRDATQAAVTQTDTQPATQPATPQHFDPNTVDSATLTAIGLRPHKARAFIRFRATGAVFRKPLDIAHIHALDDDDIDLLLPLIRISPRYQDRRKKYPIGATYDTPATPSHTQSAGTETRQLYTSNKFSTPTTVDPNTADTTLLQRIPGIGSYIATWIVRHRERLGGFHAVNQLLEVKHVTPDMLQWFDIQTDSLRYININTASFHILSSHPYIGYSRAKAIDNRRRLYGPFTNADELNATGLFTPDTLALLIPYLQY